MRPQRQPRQDEGKQRAKVVTFCCFCTQRRGSRHHNHILEKSRRISGCRSNVPYYNTHQDSESTAKLANSVNFVASEKKKKKTPRYASTFPRLTFSVSHIFRNPAVEVVMCSVWLSLCFASPCLSFPSPVSPLLLPFSRGDMLEVIITIASGFISIYSHNNTEKGRRQTALV